jgi:uncharacterized protein with HEPN domain
MSKRNNKLLLADILTAINKIQTYTQGLDYEAFMADSRTVDAVERNFEIIGEAANQLTVDFRETHGHILWHGIISFRNRLIHGYFGVDYQILWYLLQNDLPQLKIDLQAIE